METLLPNVVAVIDLRRQTLHDAVDKSWKDTKKNRDLLQKSVTGVLRVALSDFQSEIVEDSLTGKDIILLTTDAEKRLARLNNEPTYWEQEGDYFGILNCLMGANGLGWWRFVNSSRVDKSVFLSYLIKSQRRWTA